MVKNIKIYLIPNLVDPEIGHVCVYIIHIVIGVHCMH